MSRPAENGGHSCDILDGSTEDQTCNPEACAVSVACVGAWGDWDRCSLPCAGGIQTRQYTVSRPAENGGHSCDILDGSTEDQTCNPEACAVDREPPRPAPPTPPEDLGCTSVDGQRSLQVAHSSVVCDAASRFCYITSCDEGYEAVGILRCGADGTFRGGECEENYAYQPNPAPVPTPGPVVEPTPSSAVTAPEQDDLTTDRATVPPPVPPPAESESIFCHSHIFDEVLIHDSFVETSWGRCQVEV